jgi:hypothetical protein
MKNFEIVGWNLQDFRTGSERLMELLQLLSGENDRLCLEVHVRSIESVKQLSAKLSPSRFALYCWSKFESPFFDQPECQSLHSASLVFGHRFLLMTPDFDMPAYDSDGAPANSTRITFTERHPEPVNDKGRKPDSHILSLIEAVAETVVGPEFRLRTSTTMTGDTREHSYMVFLPVGKAVSLVRELCRELGLRDGLGSWEFLGSVEDLESLLTSGHYVLDEFPPDCWSWNGSVGRTPFAVGRGSFVHPVLNIEAPQLATISPVIDSLGDSIVRCSLVRKYLSWKLSSARNSPKTQGNYALLSKQKKGYAVLLGFEQYAKGDPPLKEFKAAVLPILHGFGAKLKSIPYIK